MNPPLDIFGNLAWLNKWVKNLLGRVRNLELNPSGGVQGVTGFGVDNTDPLNPIVNKFTTATITATGTIYSNAYPLSTVLSTIGGGAAYTGVRLPSAGVNYGDKYFIGNNTATVKKIYTGAINDLFINGTTVSGTTGITINPNTLYSFTLTAFGWSVNQEQVVPYKVYSALLTQTGTDDPLVNTTYQNTIGSIVWTYSTTGTYIGTLVGAFPSGKVPTVNQWIRVGASLYNLTRISNDTVELTTFNAAGATTNGLLVSTGSPIEIKVYN